jgi:phospholipid/cholesterol/gamma-HCH transport system substrate-binding protein
MNTRQNKVRLGIFLVVGLVLLLSLIGFFTARQLLEKRDTYYVSYSGVSVSGLEVGSPVKYLGITVGAISDIKIDPEDVNSIIVELSLEPGTPVKEDAKADIVAVGITGLKTIEIRGGSNEADFLYENEFIQAGSSITEEITGKAEIIAEKVEKVLNNLQVFTEPDNLNKITTSADRISSLANDASLTIAKIDTLVDENKEAVYQTVVIAHEISERLNESSQTLMSSIDEFNDIIKSDTIDQIVVNVRDISQKIRETDLEALIGSVADVADQTQKLILRVERDIRQSSEDLTESQRLIRLTLENLNEASRKISSDPSVLIRGVRKKDIPDEQLTN